MASSENVVGSRTKKKLQDLLVKELRSELDKRGFDRTGVKTVLIQRLQKVRK